MPPGPTIAAFLSLSRPHFLLGGALLHTLGAASAGHPAPGRPGAGQALVTAVQLTAHYVNEYADSDADRLVVNRTPFSGGSGVVSSGRLSPAVARWSAVATTAVSLGCSAVVARRSRAAAVVGLGALAASWGYSIPPVRLAGSGWGELVASATVAGAVPVVGALGAGDGPGERLWWAVAVLVPAHLGMMLVLELPDLDADRASGKRVLAVRTGRRRALGMVAGCAAVATAVAAAADRRGLLPGAGRSTAAVLAVAALAGGSGWAVRPRWYALVTAAAVGGFASVTCGLLLSIRRGWRR